MIKILKPFLFGLLLHLYMQINILIGFKLAYASILDAFYVILLFALPIVFGIVAYGVLKNTAKKQFCITMICFVALYVVFYVLGYHANYFNWLFNLAVFYDETMYYLDLEAMLQGVIHAISMAVVCVVYFAKTRKIK